MNQPPTIPPERAAPPCPEPPCLARVWPLAPGVPTRSSGLFGLRLRQEYPCRALSLARRQTGIALRWRDRERAVALPEARAIGLVFQDARLFPI